MLKKQALKRRQAIKLALTGLLSVPLMRLVSAAESGAKIDESDSLAQQLGYKHDASQAANRAADQWCNNCAFYQGGDADWGGCIVFGGKQVNGNGWCQSWRAAG